MYLFFTLKILIFVFFWQNAFGVRPQIYRKKEKDLRLRFQEPEYYFDFSLDQDGNTILHKAVENGDFLEVVRLVNLGHPIDLPNQYGQKPHDLALLSGNSEIDEFFCINEQFYNGSRRGYFKIVDAMLSAGACLNVRNSILQNVLSGVLGTRNLINKKIVDDMAKKLISYGVDSASKDVRGNTPLHFAASYGSKNTVKLLLQKGCFVDCENNFKDTPLHLVAMGFSVTGLTIHERLARVSNDLVNVVKVLIQAGANKNLVNREGLTPLKLARYMLQTAREHNHFKAISIFTKMINELKN